MTPEEIIAQQRQVTTVDPSDTAAFNEGRMDEAEYRRRAEMRSASTGHRVADSQSIEGNARYGSATGNASNTPTGWNGAGGGGGGSNSGGGGGGGNTASPSTSAWGERGNQFYDQLLQRSQQSLQMDRNDPIIRNQADAYSANEQRSARDYLGDLAEREGPNANLRGEQRLSSERVGQRTGAFEAQLMGRELSARRDEIMQALQMQGGMISDQMRMELQRDLAEIDRQLRSRGLDLQSRGMDLQNDQFMRDLALREWDITDRSDREWQTNL